MDTVEVRVRVHLRARRDELDEWRGGVLHVRLSALTLDGRTDAHLAAVIARRLRLVPAQVSVARGAEERERLVRVQGLDVASVERRLGRRGTAARRGGAGRPAVGRRGRRRGAVLLAVLAAAVAGVLALSGTSPNPVRPAASLPVTPAVRRHDRGHGKRAARRDRATGRRHRHRVHRRAPDPGSLPQTAALPSATTHLFRAHMRLLWRAVVKDRAALARAAFFPEQAYVQLKAVGDPAGDFLGRLFENFTLDVGAAHALLGAGAPHARLIGVRAVAAYAHWIPAGVCENRVGYYELPGPRVVYRENGVERSFGIASMISWRGVWYVIHFGEILRPVVVGVVDDPSAGPGVPAPSSTC